MTPEEIKEAAQLHSGLKYGIDIKNFPEDPVFQDGVQDFTAGAEWGSKEERNRTIEDAIVLTNNALMLASNSSEDDLQTLIEELKKLKR